MADSSSNNNDRKPQTSNLQTRINKRIQFFKSALLTTGGISVLIAIAALFQAFSSGQEQSAAMREQSAAMLQLIQIQSTSLAVQNTIAESNNSIATAIAEGKDPQQILEMKATVTVLVGALDQIFARERELRATANPGATPLPTFTPLPTLEVATKTPDPEPTITPAPTAISTSSPVPATTTSSVCEGKNPYQLHSDQLSRLGCEDGGFVRSRGVVTQRFDNGFMIVFDDSSDSDFTRINQRRRMYAVADDGQVWRVFFDPETVVQNTSPNPDDWYSCEKRPGLRPSQSRIPWRGFGMAWCTYPDIRNALGLVAPGAEEIKERASFQSYEHGRAFAFGGRTYVTFFDPSLDLATSKFVFGRWE